jgi:oxygen-independent coproporphyrinogen III oxidase
MSLHSFAPLRSDERSPHAARVITAAEMARFSIEAPRYTSYPTAAEFSTEVGGAAFRAALQEVSAASSGPPLALYVHLPFCRDICHFCGCHALVARTPERIVRYLAALANEATEVAKVLGGARAVGELHFGGGSPSLLEADDLERFVDVLRAAFPFQAQAGLSIEADPRTTDLAKLRRYRALGIRRISFGFQDLDPDVQRAIGRNQSAEISRNALATARAVGFDGINVDLCYGLPGQTQETFSRTITEVIGLRPDRVAIFGYAHVPWLKPMQRLIAPSTLPGAELRVRMMAASRDALIAAGYRAIGLDHFALPTDDLALAVEAGTLNRNFQGYTTTAADALIGLGLSAISDLPRGYFQNQRVLANYHRATDERALVTERGILRTADDVRRGEIIRTLMCRFHLNIPAFERRFGITFDETYAPEISQLRALEDQGLVRLTADDLDLTPLGAVFVRNVARTFDAHRRGDRPGGASRFSSTA